LYNNSNVELKEFLINAAEVIMKKFFILFITISSFLFAQDFQVSNTGIYSVDPPHIAIAGSTVHLAFGTNFSYFQFDKNGPAAPIDNPIRPVETSPYTTDIVVDPTNSNHLAIVYYTYHYDSYNSSSFFIAYVTESNDNGANWETPVLLDTIQNGSSIGNITQEIPVAKFSNAGNLYLLWKVHQNSTTTNALYLSKNLGTKIRIDDPNTNDLELAVSLDVETFNGTEWVAVSYGKTVNSKVNFYLKYSSDGASSFSDEILVKNDGETFLTIEHQTTVFMNAGGKFMYVYRDFAHGPKLITSDDSGVTWKDQGTVESHKYVYVALRRMPGTTNYFVKAFMDNNDNLTYFTSTDLLDWNNAGQLNSSSATISEAGSYLDISVQDDYTIAAAWIDNRTDNEEIFYGKGTLPTVGINDQSSELPTEFTLLPNYPNPFNPSTNIAYQLPYDSQVKVEIFNTLGERVDLLVDKVENAGFHSVVWNISNRSKISSGTYIIKLTALSLNNNKVFTDTRKMLLLK
jgi:hypothetical protein